MDREAFMRACAADKSLRFADGRYVVAAEKRTDRAVCWASAVDGGVLRRIFAEIDRLGLKRPIKVYGYVCSVSETETFRFEQVEMGVPDPTLSEGASEGAVFKHLKTGAEIVLVQKDRYGGGWLNVQLNVAEGHRPGWVSVLYDDAADWKFLRWAE